VLLPKDPTPVALPGTERTPRCGYRGLRCVLSWVITSYNRHIGGETCLFIAIEVGERTGTDQAHI
jgi:hypothetical protein